MTLTVAPPTTAGRSTLARTFAAAAAAALILNSIVGAVAFFAGQPELDDHTSGLGALSEVTTGAAFLAAAVTLALMTPVSGWRAASWWLAPFGLALAGGGMLLVPITGTEPPVWLFLLSVIPIAVGMIAVGILGTKRLWPWWVGLGLALFLPIMFTVPFSGPLLAAIWVSVVVTVKRSHGSANPHPVASRG